MKKLLIAMTAAAVGTCAWAEGEAGGEGAEPTTITYFTETFADWSNDAEAGYVTSVADSGWSYGTVAEDGEGNPTLNTADPQADELKVVNEALSLNTGSKVLRGAFGESTVAIPDGGLYFNATIAFKDPSDTLPTLMSSDKFAIVALDNVESLEAGLTNVNTKAATNLWVIAHHETEGKRAYRLTGNLESTWFKDSDGVDVNHTIVVKAYNNVVGTRAGFLVMLDGEICTVKESYAISTGNVIDFTTAVDGTNNYLGYENSEVSLGERYQKGQLLLSMVNNSSLASVDFQGQGVIDELSLADAGADFGPDVTSKTVTFTGFNSEGIASISPLLDNGVYTIPSGTANGNIEFAVTLNAGYVLEATGATVAGTAPNYTVTYAYIGADSHTIALNVFKPAAYVGDNAYDTVQAALTYIAENASGTGTVVLNDNVTLTDDDVDSNGLTISSGEITIDLNGNTIVAEECNTIGVTGGKLIVEDSKGGGAILAAENYFAIDVSAGLTEIKAGTIGLINNYDNAATLKLVGGSYTDVGETFYLTPEQMKYDGKQYIATSDAEGVWTVAEKVVVKYEVTLSVSNVTVTGLTAGEYEAGTSINFTVAAADGYENPVVTVGGVVLEANADDSFTITVDAAKAVVITATAIVTGPTIDDPEGDITVNETTGDATIDTTNATVTVTGTVTGDVIVTPSVGTVNVTLATGKTVKIYSGETDITGAFTVSSENGTTTIELNRNGSVTINGETIYVEPEMAAATTGDDAMKAPLEVGTDVAVGVKTIPGLMYQLIRSDAPNGTFEGVGDAVKGTGVPVKLEDKNKPNGKGFYKIKVSQR